MRSAIARIGLGLAIGCQADRPAPPAADPRPASEAGARAATPAAITPAPAAPAPVSLPNSPSTPPRRTDRPLDRAALERLAAFEFADFEREPRGAPAASLEVRHTTRTRPRLGVTIQIAPCARRAAGPGPHDCPPMELAVWQPIAGQLRNALPEALRARADTQFELGVRELAGARAIYTYALGAAFGNDRHDQPAGDYADAYTLHYNDGVNRIRVIANYRDDAVGGIDQLRAVAPKEDLEQLALAFASFYVHAWN